MHVDIFYMPVDFWMYFTSVTVVDESAAELVTEEVEELATVVTEEVGESVTDVDKRM